MSHNKKIMSLLLVLGAGILLLSSCSGSSQAAPNAGSNGTASGITGPRSDSDQIYRSSWFNPTISGDTVSVSADDVQKKGIENFALSSPSGSITFMAYSLDGKIYVRADICPPCRTKSFTLRKGRLICDTCGTVFDGKTGAGIQGACVAYPKASVPYINDNGTLTMKADDLATAFQKTVQGRGI